MRAAGAHAWSAPLRVTRPRLAYVCVTPAGMKARVFEARCLVLQDNETRAKTWIWIFSSRQTAALHLFI